VAAVPLWPRPCRVGTLTPWWGNNDNMMTGDGDDGGPPRSAKMTGNNHHHCRRHYQCPAAALNTSVSDVLVDIVGAC